MPEVPGEDAIVARGLFAHLVGARLQRIDLTSAGHMLLELYRGDEGGRHWLFWDGHVLAAAEGRLAKDAAPPAAQRRVREELVPGALAACATPRPDLTRLEILRPTGAVMALWLESGANARILLVRVEGESDRVVAVIAGKARDTERDLRRGRAYVWPVPPAALHTPRAEPSTTLKPREKADNERSMLRATEKRLARLKKNLELDLKNAGSAVHLAHEGELLKSVFSTLKRGVSVVEVEAPDSGIVRIAVDPTHTPAAMLTHRFRAARRARATVEQALPRREAATAALATAARLRAALDAALDPEDLAAVREEVRFFCATHKPSPRAVRRQEAIRGQRRGARVFVGSGDVEIRVGRSAKDNDALTFQWARGHDTWFHARGTPGAHVVVQVALDRLSAELLADAALLALHFSPLRASGRGEVQYAPRKLLKRPGPKAAPGLVAVSGERVIFVVSDVKRIEALLATER